MQQVRILDGIKLIPLSLSPCPRREHPHQHQHHQHRRRHRCHLQALRGGRHGSCCWHSLRSWFLLQHVGWPLMYVTTRWPKVTLFGCRKGTCCWRLVQVEGRKGPAAGAAGTAARRCSCCFSSYCLYWCLRGRSYCCFHFGIYLIRLLSPAPLHRLAATPLLLLALCSRSFRDPLDCMIRCQAVALLREMRCELGRVWALGVAGEASSWCGAVPMLRQRCGCSPMLEGAAMQVSHVVLVEMGASRSLSPFPFRS